MTRIQRIVSDTIYIARALTLGYVAVLFVLKAKGY